MIKQKFILRVLHIREFSASGIRKFMKLLEEDSRLYEEKFMGKLARRASSAVPLEGLYYNLFIETLMWFNFYTQLIKIFYFKKL